MARSVILGNGRLTVGLNEKGLVHDFYYPYVGLDNLTTARSLHHKIGVWVDGQFSWTDDASWQSLVDFSDQALVSNVVLKNTTLNIELQLHDFVDFELDVLCRQVTVKNTAGTEREVRIFMHQVFEISRAGRADTALFVPEEHYILDYKGRCLLLIGGSDGTNCFDQYAVGSYGIEGKEGTFKDAEDGSLSNHNVEHGGVDSVIRFNATIDADSEYKFDYWVVAADSQYNGERIHNKLQRDGLQNRLDLTQEYWREWLAVGAERLANVQDKYQSMVNKSLMMIKAHTDERGGIIASCDSSIYNFGRDYYSYVWPRDGAYAIWPLIRLGYGEEPKAFFNFCRDILTPGGYLMHKYQPDRAIGSTWHPLVHNNRKELAIQEDETAVIIAMLGEYHHYSGDDDFVRSMYDSFVKPATHFLVKFMDRSTGLPHASYDLWEEKFLTSTYTTAVVYRALITAADFAEQFGNAEDAELWNSHANGLLKNRQTFVDPERAAYRKGFLLEADESLSFDNTLDMSSLYGIITYGYMDESDKGQLRASIECVENVLKDKSPSGGIVRYEHDNYFRKSDDYLGNPWLITTLWMAQFYIRLRRYDEAAAIVDWTLTKALSSGVMPEQIHPETGEPLSVTPLVWSHAEFINTVLDLSHQQKSE